MSSQDWESFGEEIRKTVQDAVETQNYDKLNQMISNTIDRAADCVAKTMKNAANSSQEKYKGYKTYTTDYERARGVKEVPKKPAGMQYTNTKSEVQPQNRKFEIKTPSRIGAIIPIVIGYTLAFFQFLSFFVTLVVSLTGPFEKELKIMYLVMCLFFLVIMLLGILLGTWGIKQLSRIGRFKQYVQIIGTKEYCNISDLSGKVGRPTPLVVKDLEYMISSRWFCQGHLDKQKTCLMVTDKMYGQYCQLEQQRLLEEKEAQQKERENQNAYREGLSPEVRKVIAQGDEYIRKIRACNDAIPGEEISAKIFRIETLIDKIFDRVEQNPKSVSDIRKLMEYYLPTTVKLLEAYAQMDAQPAGGENIRNAKKEIEDTLDTLNVAFEKLLDSLFQETAWDVSSDISVLNTMLTQEGLKEDGLKK